jgi:adenylate kinase family enzyme
MLIIFSGLPGSGKSTVAKIVQRLGRSTCGLIPLSRPFVQFLNRVRKRAEGYFAIYGLASENLKLLHRCDRFR